MNATRRGRTHNVPSATHADFCRNLLDFLAIEHGAAVPLNPEDGLTELALPAGVLRIARSAADGFLALELIADRRADGWEAFHLRLGDGSSRCGWRRHGLETNPPTLWAEAASSCGFASAPIVDPKTDVGFLALCAQMLKTTGSVQHVQADAEVHQLLADEAQHWKSIAKQQADQLREQRGKIEQLLIGKAATTGSAAPVVTESGPRSLKELGSWAAENIERIVILPRALGEARKSDYEEPGLVFDALEFLAGDYRDMRLGLLDRAEVEHRLGELKLFMGGSIDASRAGEQGDTYFVSWGRRRRFLDQHVGRGTSRESRYVLRIYFFWDDEQDLVVVGWLPSHLDNKLT